MYGRISVENHQKRMQLQSYKNTDAGTWARTGDADETHFYSDFDLCRATAVGSPQHVSYREPLERNKRLFTAWVVKLNNENQLVVEGSLECGRRARTKPIAERLGPSKILSKFKHLYYLVGNMADSHNGFPEDWEIVVKIWRSFLASESDEGLIRDLSSMSEILIAEEVKLKSTIDYCAGSHCFTECAQKVNRVHCETHLANKYYKNGEHGETIANQGMSKSIVDYESQDEDRPKTLTDLKQLTRWTPLVVPDENLKYCLVFRGTLLSSMGHAMSKNHMTDAVHKRHSPRIIETVSREFYELVGDINNTKRDVPKELVTWCRYGCPKRIHSFCKKWRILRSNEIKHSPQGEMKIGQDQGTQCTICHDKSANLIINSRTDSLSRGKKKRKRILMELTDNCGANDTSDVDTTYNLKPGAMLINNSRAKSWPKVRRKSRTNSLEAPRVDTDIAEGENLNRTEQIRPTFTHKSEERLSPLKRVPSISYVYHKSSALMESSLSDGV